MTPNLPQLRATTTGKILFIAALTLLLLIPLAMIRDLIGEREQTRMTAEADIARAWGGEQIIGGPIVVVPISYGSRRLPDGSYGDATTDELFALPAELTIDADTSSQILERGIFEVPVYTAALGIAGVIRPPEFDPGSYPDLDVRWDEAVLALPLSDARSVSEPVRISIAGQQAAFGPGGTRVPGFGNQLVVALSDLGIGELEEPLAFTLELALGGSRSLGFLPLGDVTRVAIDSDWPSPSFQGEYLPDQRQVDSDGFSAAWQVLSLGRGYPSDFSRSSSAQSVETRQAYGASFGVTLMPPLSVHTAAFKASKYGVLFVGLTFIAFFLFEVFRKLRLHPMHYLSIGMANIIFYLLLLALAEHIGFGLAYLVSAVASIALIGGYASSVLGSPQRALPVVLLLSLTYLQLYMILNADDYAVLIGALTLFALLAAFMYLTRRVDWYQLDLRSAPQAGAA